MSSSTTHLFVYGILQDPRVMEAACGALPPCEPARLHGYRCIRLKDRTYPGLIEAEDTSVCGLVYTLENLLLQRLDDFEGEEYQRSCCEVERMDGTPLITWVYQLSPDSHSLALEESWDLNAFLPSHVQAFLT